MDNEVKNNCSCTDGCCDSTTPKTEATVTQPIANTIEIIFGKDADTTIIKTTSGEVLSQVIKVEIELDAEQYLPIAKLTFLNPKISTA